MYCTSRTILYCTVQHYTVHHAGPAYLPLCELLDSKPDRCCNAVWFATNKPPQLYVCNCTKCCYDWCLHGYTKQQAVTWCPTRDQPEGRKHVHKNFITFKLLQNETFRISSHLCKNKVMFRKTFQENTKVNIFVPTLLRISVANNQQVNYTNQLKTRK